MRAKDQLIAAAAQSPVLAGRLRRRPAARAADGPGRSTARRRPRFGVTFEEINNTISTNLGSSYINDFPNRGRMQRVIVQADGNARMQPDQILTYNVRNTSGQLVPFSSFATVRWSVGPSQIVGFNYYPSVRLSGSAKPGYTTGDAIARDGTACRAPAEGLRLRMGGAVAAGETIRLAGAVAADAVGVVGVPRPRRALRELDHPACRSC